VATGLPQSAQGLQPLDDLSVCYFLSYLKQGACNGLVFCPIVVNHLQVVIIFVYKLFLVELTSREMM